MYDTSISFAQNDPAPQNGLVYKYAATGCEITVTVDVGSIRDLRKDIKARSGNGSIICTVYQAGQVVDEFWVYAPFLGVWAGRFSSLATVSDRGNEQPYIDTQTYASPQVPLVLFLQHGHIVLEDDQSVSLQKYTHIVSSMQLFRAVFFSDQKINKLNSGLYAEGIL